MRLNRHVGVPDFARAEAKTKLGVVKPINCTKSERTSRTKKASFPSSKAMSNLECGLKVWEQDVVIGQAFDRGGKDGITGWIGPQVRFFSSQRLLNSLFCSPPFSNPLLFRVKLVPTVLLEPMVLDTELVDTVRERKGLAKFAKPKASDSNISLPFSQTAEMEKLEFLVSKVPLVRIHKHALQMKKTKEEKRDSNGFGTPRESGENGPIPISRLRAPPFSPASRDPQSSSFHAFSLYFDKYRLFLPATAPSRKIRVDDEEETRGYFEAPTPSVASLAEPPQRPFQILSNHPPIHFDLLPYRSKRPKWI